MSLLLPSADLIRSPRSVENLLPQADWIRILPAVCGEEFAQSLEVKSQIDYQVKSKLADQQPTAAVDMDGTLTVPHPHWPKVDIDKIKVREGAAQGIQELKQAGWRIIIFTMHDDIDGVADWLDENDIPFDFINENPDQDSKSPKVMAHVYIDDRSISAQQSWPNIVREVLTSHFAEPAKTKHTILTGHSGSGKSTIAKVLGERLSLPVWKVDNDELWKQNKDLADHPDRYTKGTKEAKQFRKLLKKLVRRAVAKEEPHILEGCQFLACTGSLRGHNVIVIGGDEDTIIAQRLKRDFEDGKLQRDGQEKRVQKAIDLYRKLQPDIERLISREGVKSISPHESEEWARRHVFETTMHQLIQSGEDPEIAKQHATELANFHLFDGKKALSAYDNTAGGALVAPPQQGLANRRKCLKCASSLVKSGVGWRCSNPSCDWSVFAAGDMNFSGRKFIYRKKGWITIGGAPCEEGEHCGGTRVYIDGSGNIRKGPKAIKNKNVSKLREGRKQKESPQPPQIKPVPPEKLQPKPPENKNSEPENKPQPPRKEPEKPPEPPKKQHKMQPVVDELAKRYGYPLEKITIQEDPGKEFTVAGRQCRSAGNCNLKTGNINLFPGGLKDKMVVHRVLSHEIMHGQYEQVAYNPRVQDFVADHYDELLTEDGVTDYSKSYWKAFDKLETSYHIAIHETLAEIRSSGEIHEPIQIGSTWKEFYQLVLKEIQSTSAQRKSLEQSSSKPEFQETVLFFDADWREVPADSEQAVYCRIWKEDGTTQLLIVTK